MDIDLFGESRLMDEPFEMPDEDSPRADWLAALARINGVEMTIDQLERGMTQHFPGPHQGAMDRLIAFCASEGFRPANLAAQAMTYRWTRVGEALEGDIVLKRDRPAEYASLVTQPIEELLFYGSPEEFAADNSMEDDD